MMQGRNNGIKGTETNTVKETRKFARIAAVGMLARRKRAV